MNAFEALLLEFRDSSGWKWVSAPGCLESAEATDQFHNANARAATRPFWASRASPQSSRIVDGLNEGKSGQWRNRRKFLFPASANSITI
jgi:hypothetical protein